MNTDRQAVVDAYAPLESALVDLVTLASNAVYIMERLEADPAIKAMIAAYSPASPIRLDVSAKILMASALAADAERAKVMMRISLIPET